MRQIIRHTRIKELYNGLGFAAMFNIPALSTYLFIYDYTKAMLDNHGSKTSEINNNTTSANISNISSYHLLSRNSFVNHTISAVLAEVVSGLFWTPMEVVKSRTQVGDGMWVSFPNES